MEGAASTIRASPQRHSPCVGVCRLDAHSGLCLGCARSGDEIARWSSLNELERKAIWDELPERAARLGAASRLLPMTPQEILAWVAHAIEARLGTWVTGMPGAVAEFIGGREQKVTTTLAELEVVAETPTGLFRLRYHDKLRAFAFNEGGPIALGLPKSRLTRPTTDVFSWVGEDRDAIQDQERNDALFDYGLGPKSSRFCIRTGNGTLRSRLEPLSGRPWPEVMAEAGVEIIAKSPTRVVESELVRIEVLAPIPLPGGRSPEGAHTHFLPHLVASGDDIPSRFMLPDYAAPMAIFYPA